MGDQQIGNKCDLSNQRSISTEEAVAYAEKHNMAFIETSAYDKTGIEEAFNIVLKRILLQFYMSNRNLRVEFEQPTGVSGNQ